MRKKNQCTKFFLHLEFSLNTPENIRWIPYETKNNNKMLPVSVFFLEKRDHTWNQNFANLATCVFLIFLIVTPYACYDMTLQTKNCSSRFADK